MMRLRYGGNDPRSYIGYIDSLWDYVTLPNGQPLDINRFYYGSQGVSNLNTLKSVYDPTGKFQQDQLPKHIEVIRPPEAPLSGDWGPTTEFNPEFQNTGDGLMAGPLN